VPPGIAPADNETGWRMSLDKLANLVEVQARTVAREDLEPTKGRLTMDRRSILKTSSAALGGALAAGCASVAADAKAPHSPFKIAGITLPIAGSAEVFPVRRIYCIGRNYAAHAREMGSDPTREPPFFFQKPTDAVQFIAIGTVADHPYPSLTKNYHYELELVAALKSGGTNIPIDQALQHVYGYAIGLDMTRRDLQRGMGDQKKPWEIGKSFDMSAPIGPIHPVALLGSGGDGQQHITKGRIELKVNGQTKQLADLSYMIWSVAEQISKLSEAFELKAGDIIYSGTPENVGPVVKGDVLLGHIDGLPELSVRIV
jgi:fumarylpyruvate hydrolase